MDNLYYLESAFGKPLAHIFQCILKIIKSKKRYISKLTVKHVAEIIANFKKEESYSHETNKFDFLVDDVVEEIMLKLDRPSLANLCYSSKRLSRICNKDTFKTKYDNSTIPNLKDWIISQGFPDNITEVKKSWGIKSICDIISFNKKIYVSRTKNNNEFGVDSQDLSFLLRFEIISSSSSSVEEENINTPRNKPIGFESGDDFYEIYIGFGHEADKNWYETTLKYEVDSLTGKTQKYINEVKFDGTFTKEMFPNKVLNYMRKMGFERYIIGRSLKDIEIDINSYAEHIAEVTSANSLKKNNKLEYDGRTITYETDYMFSSVF